MSDSSREAVIEAAKQAQADGFVSELESDYDTLIGEQGVGLSGGQQQRVAIARALLKAAPSSFWMRQHQHSITNQNPNTVGAGCLTGRSDNLCSCTPSSTIESADTVLVMDEGRVVAAGSHSSLLEQEPIYRSLHQQGFNDA